MLPNIFEVTRIGTGALCIMPRPDGRHLPAAIRFFKRLGVNKVVCLMETSEMQECRLSQEAELCQQASIDFVHFPITDKQLPLNEKAFRQLVNTLHNALNEGQNVAIHCRAGIGRTGILAGCILVHDGYEADAAIRMMTHARGYPMPETTAQHDFICAYRSRMT